MKKIVNGVEHEMTQEEEQAWQAEVAARQVESPSAWIIKRQCAYGLLAEQLDKLYHDLDEEKLDKTGSFYLHIKAVKEAFPKPAEE